MMTNATQNRNARGLGPTLPPAEVSPVEGDIIAFGALFSTIWRGKWFIGALAMLFVIAGGYYAFVVAKPLFRSTAVVILKTQQDSIVDLQSVVSGLTGDTSEVNSEVEVLRARGLIGKVVDQLDLIDDPEFNAGLRPDTLVRITKRQVKARLGLLRPAVVKPPEEQTKYTRDRVISELLGKVSVRNLPLSLVFQVSVETGNPRKSALIADTIARRYILNQLEVKYEATEQATSWLTGRVAELQTQFEKASSAVSSFNASTELVSLEVLQAQDAQLKDLRERIRKVLAAKEVAQARLDALKSAETRNDKALLADDPQLTGYLIKIATDDQIAVAFDTRFSQEVLRAGLDVNRAELQLKTLQAAETEAAAQNIQQGKDLIRLQHLTREAEAIRLLYEHFLTRLKETAAQQGVQQADSRILSNAVVPTKATSPNKPLILAMSGILGLMLGLGLVLVREARSTGYRTARDLEAHTGYCVLGQIPQIPTRTRKRVIKYLSDKPTSAAAEFVRSLRTSLLQSNLDKPPKVIVLTSSVPDEGKTTNSMALALNLGGLGKSVLLIEGDIRRRAFAQFLDGLPDKGLVSVLSGDQTLEEAAFRCPALGVDVLVGENSANNAADLFATDEFKALIDEARAQYDVVLIDTPPILVVPDARIVAQVADCVLITVHWDKTPQHHVDEALRLLRASNLEIAGFILSQINTRRMKQYGFGGVYSGYGANYYAN